MGTGGEGPRIDTAEEQTINVNVDPRCARSPFTNRVVASQVGRVHIVNDAGPTSS